MKPKTTEKKFDFQRGAFNLGHRTNIPTCEINPVGTFRIFYNNPKDRPEGVTDSTEITGRKLLEEMERITGGSRDKGRVLARMSFTKL